MQPAHDLTFADFTTLLRARDFSQLFNRLGWDNIPRGTPAVTLTVPAETGGLSFTFQPVKQKHGFVVLHCADLPETGQRRRLSLEMSKKYAEHLLIFAPAGAAAEQLWQLVVRDPGEPVRYFEFRVGPQQPLDLWNRVEGLAISLDDERGLTLAQVRERTRRAFTLNAEKVTKKFYAEFSKQHQGFQALIEGIEGSTDRAWYTSIMLNRIMFIYFVQAQGYLLVDAGGPSGEADKRYLAYKLAQCAKLVGKDQFQSFYRDFLRVLFRDGLNAPLPHAGQLSKLLGRVPYLNGGLFEEHELERANPKLHIPDKAFEKLFEFLGKWDWILDSRHQATGTTINPDVIGYIFERYINERAQMGAYYTKEDITEYIAKNCLVPALFDRIAATVPHESEVWNLLRDYPQRYLYPAQLKGIDLPLPADVEAARTDVAARSPLWNRPTPDEYALPTEIWRETVQRRDRTYAAQARLMSGEVRSINELITLNLDVRQFLHDAIANSGSAEWVWACFEALRNLSILDPTCGSGAFLFAALRILEPLYQECLDRMEAFLPELDNPKVLRVKKDVVRGMREVRRKLVEEHQDNRAYFITKTIILHNLYGVDLMHEAVEIAKLRLFLQLMSTLPEPDYDDNNLGLEPLPDVDFNIRAGNTLVGFATLEEVRAVAYKQEPMFADVIVKEIGEQTKLVAELGAHFRELSEEDDPSLKKAKQDLTEHLAILNDKLNEYQGVLYGKDARKHPEKFDEWCEECRPFNWFAEFFEIIHEHGGFDVIIGNPPYLELRQINYELIGYKSADTAAVHAVCMERSMKLVNPKGMVGMIVPLSLVSTQRMKVVQQILEYNRSVWYSNLSWRPAKLFDTVNRALTIFLSLPADNQHVYTTTYFKWISDTRDGLIERLNYTEVQHQRKEFWIAKMGESIENGILNKMLAVGEKLSLAMAKSNNRVYYRTDGGLYWKVFTDEAPAFRVNGKDGHSTRETWLTLNSASAVFVVIAALSSNTFWWWYTVTSNCRHLNPYDVQNFPIAQSFLKDIELQTLGKKYLKDIKNNSQMLTRIQKQTGETQTQSFKISKSKSIIDEIDTVLAKYYGFKPAELDFIINYDIKYRMGAELDDED